ncbi:MAG: hypothetical protein NC218_02395 [Acetobacter sp.]|nr:hypothetical protein [Acetobacter sp.]
MADIITEVILPSNGKLYGDNVQWKNQLRAPRLKDRGLGDSTRKLKLQASILDKTFVQPLGMSAYDLHTADFLYLNMKQRQLSKGNSPYKVAVVCNACGKRHDIDIKFEDLEIKPLLEVPDLSYKMVGEEDMTLELTYMTPRMVDESVEKAREFLEEYSETDLTEDDLKTQELLRMLIKRVNGKILSVPQMTDFIQNMLIQDVDGIMNTVNDFDFGVQLIREFNCDKCGKKVKFLVPTGA